ncbi:copper transpport protein [Tieghemiomyces parasiticus]|uniref:Copper transport protein n=1 Tax=Tieghemiomyces parasiticus TaxID=78921 RepID=A0A9W8ABB4_9FUNG|nr:copper transpport protein [Tieghemiomyces parasiticus]
MSGFDQSTPFAVSESSGGSTPAASGSSGHDHSSMAGMDMSGASGHDSMGSCGMGMFLNGNERGFCLLFSTWTISSDTALGVACLVVFFLSIAYEILKLLVRRVEYRLHRRIQRSARLTAKEMELATEEGSDVAATGVGTPDFSTVSGPQRGLIGWFEPIYFLRSLLYGVQVFYAFMLMLIVMTFNIYLIVSVTIGSIVGFYLFGRDEASGRLAPTCH